MIEILILDVGNNTIELSSESKSAGTQFDNYANDFLFLRPDQFINDDLIVFIKDARNTFEPINLKSANSLSISNALTQTTKINLQIAFKCNDLALNHSNQLSFTLRDSILTGTASPESPVPKFYIDMKDEKILSDAKYYTDSKILSNGIGGTPGKDGIDGKDGLSEISTSTPVQGIPDGKIFSVSGGKVIGIDSIAGGVTIITPTTQANEFTWGMQLTTDADRTIGEVHGSGTFYNRKIMLFGDSITAGSLWRTPFSQLINAKSLDNIAVSGASWRDGANAVLDGNPVTNGPSNMIANQVQKVINNFSSYQTPEIIIFFAGVNDSYGTVIHSIANIDQYYVSGGEYTPLTNLDRKNLPSAIRWSVETVRSMYPYAHIILVTPYQTAADITEYKTIKSTRDVIVESALRLGTPCIDLFNTSGIYGAFEKKSESGRYLSDGLHPNAIGGSLIANRIFDTIKNLSFPYREMSLRTNLLHNADFSSGTTGWIPPGNITLSASEGVLTVKPTASFSSSMIQFRQDYLSYIPGHKYYARIMTKSEFAGTSEFKSRYISFNSAGSTMITAKATHGTDWISASGVFTALSDTNRFTVVLIFSSTTTTPRAQELLFKEAMLLDLTALYGEGNEPSAQYLDECMKFFIGNN